MWQLIETAPKDKDVLLCCPMRGVVRGRWNDCKHSKNPRPYWTHDREMLYGVISTRNDQPTHWMPLPEEPGAQAQPAPSVPDGWIQRGMAELEAIRNRQDDDTLLDDRTLIERIGKAMLAAAPEAKP